MRLRYCVKEYRALSPSFFTPEKYIQENREKISTVKKTISKKSFPAILFLFIQNSKIFLSFLLFLLNNNRAFIFNFSLIFILSGNGQYAAQDISARTSDRDKIKFPSGYESIGYKKNNQGNKNRV